MRSVPPWQGKTDDAKIPVSVKRRILERQGGKCAVTGFEFFPGVVYHFDHLVPLWEGGKHHEDNIVAILQAVHVVKTRREAPVRAKIYRQKDKHLGLTEKKPWNKLFRKKMDGTVVKR